MTTTVKTNEQLLDDAVRLGHHASREEAVAAALDEYVKRRERQRMTELAGTVDFVEDYDHKAGRRKR